MQISVNRNLKSYDKIEHIGGGPFYLFGAPPDLKKSLQQGATTKTENPRGSWKVKYVGEIPSLEEWEFQLEAQMSFLNESLRKRLAQSLVGFEVQHARKAIRACHSRSGGIEKNTEIFFELMLHFKKRWMLSSMQVTLRECEDAPLHKHEAKSIGLHLHLCKNDIKLQYPMPRERTLSYYLTVAEATGLPLLYD